MHTELLLPIRFPGKQNLAEKFPLSRERRHADFTRRVPKSPNARGRLDPWRGRGRGLPSRIAQESTVEAFMSAVPIEKLRHVVELPRGPSL